MCQLHAMQKVKVGMAFKGSFIPVDIARSSLYSQMINMIPAVLLGYVVYVHASGYDIKIA